MARHGYGQERGRKHFDFQMRLNSREERYVAERMMQMRLDDGFAEWIRG